MKKFILSVLCLCLLASEFGISKGFAQRQGAFDPNAIQNPNKLCRVLAGVGLDFPEGWGASRSVEGGYVCRPLGASVDIGIKNIGMPTILNSYVYGGAARKLDRFTLKLNIFDRTTADAGKAALLSAANIVANDMGLQLPTDVERLIRSQPVRILNNASSGPPRTLFRQQVGTMVIHLETDQSRVTSLLLHFRNPNASDLWN